jgi:hypothetical protein
VRVLTKCFQYFILYYLINVGNIFVRNIVILSRNHFAVETQQYILYLLLLLLLLLLLSYMSLLNTAQQFFMVN